MRMQMTVGAWLTVAVTLGTTVAVFPAREWLVIPVVALCTAAASVLSDALRGHPPGPLFPVVAIAACASIPTEPSRIPVAFAIAGGSALLSVLIGGLGYIHPRARRAPQTALSASFRRTWRSPATFAQMTRFAVAVVVAGVIPTATGLGHPYWAMVAAVAATSGPDTISRLVRGGHRVLGTFAGVLVAGVLLALQPSVFVTIVLVVVM